MEQQILVVEDDAELREAVQQGLREEGFECHAAATAARFLELVEHHLADGLVIDIGLPDADGRDLCQAVRARGVTTPVVFLTARDALPDRLSGFAAGGDDYLTKPFDVRRARGSAAYPGSALPAKPLDPSAFAVDPLTYTARFGGESVALTPTEYRLLSLLVARSSEVVWRQELIHAGWPHGAIVHDNTLDTYLARLRRKLAPAPRCARDRDEARCRLPPADDPPPLPRSIRSRLLLATVVSVGVALILLVLAFNLLFARRLSVNATDQARARAAAALSTIDMSGGQVEVREAPDGAAADAPVWVFVDGRALEAPGRRRSTMRRRESPRGTVERWTPATTGLSRYRSSRAAARSVPLLPPYRSRRTKRRSTPG